MHFPRFFLALNICYDQTVETIVPKFPAHSPCIWLPTVDAGAPYLSLAARKNRSAYLENLSDL